MTDTPPEEQAPDIRGPIVMTMLALLLGVAPWPTEPLPHLVQKLGFLVEGTLTKPIDIFDLVLHGGPTLVAIGFWVSYVRDKVKS